MAKKLAYEVDMDTKSAEKGLDNLKKKTKDLSKEEKKQANDRKKQLQDQKKEQEDLVNGLGVFGITIGGIKQGFKSMATGAKMAFKSIKVGLISTGIGVFIVAIGAIVTSFKNSKEGAEKLEVAFAKIGAATKVLIDRFASFGKLVIDSFKLMMAPAMAFAKILKGDFKGALDGIKTAFQDVKESGVETFAGINKEIQEEVKLMGDLMKAEQELKDAKRDLNVEFAQQRAELENLKKIAEDTTKSQQERVDSAKTAFAMENEMMAKRVANAEEELRIQRERMATNDNLEEDYEKEAELLIKVANIKQESATKQIELNNKINSINREIEAQKEQARTKEEQQEAERLASIQKEKDALANLHQQRKEESAERNAEFADLQLSLESKLEQELEALERERREKEKIVNNQYLYEQLSFEEHQEVMAELTEKYDTLQEEARTNAINSEIAQNMAKQDALMQQRLDFAGSVLSSIQSIGATQTQKEMTILDNAFKKGNMSEEQYNKKKEQIERKAIQREKKMAMFQLLVDTASAVSSGIAGAMASATATGPGAVFTAPGFIASMIALALSSVAQGYAILNKVPGGGGGGGSTPTTTGGGGDEGIDRSGETNSKQPTVNNTPTFNADALLGTAQLSGASGMPPVQAYVVETEISDSQSLVDELEFQTTL